MSQQTNYHPHSMTIILYIEGREYGYDNLVHELVYTSTDQQQ